MDRGNKPTDPVGTNMKQMGQGCKTYLVKWKGYPTSDNTISGNHGRTYMRIQEFQSKAQRPNKHKRKEEDKRMSNWSD